jgi:hypothetical protein
LNDPSQEIIAVSSRPAARHPDSFNERLGDRR